MIFEEYIISPLNQTDLMRIENEHYVFVGGDRYPIVQEVPILVAANNSMFELEGIIQQKPLTQNKSYSNKRNLKNFIRTSLLPKLNKDWALKERYKNLATRVTGGKVLIIGAGSKIDFYKSIFQQSSIVITSDIHLQYNPDIVFDVHQIPFKSEAFDLVLAAQVMEHTIRPWIAASELERVVKPNGLIQVEVPFAFPYHGAPYDFFRFTFTGMRSLFRYCRLEAFMASEGTFTAAAVTNAQALVEISRSKIFRYPMLVLGRFLFFWLKYLDFFKSGRKLNDMIWPKGMVFTFVKDGKERSDFDCLADYQSLK
ncbi:MAG: class I SAM-dependent methyltransferase [Cyclobacteriaceae bacterium]|nr:MAG: class I SAM-dependent methyltransferase [Cyclobacteriaceae bacterium]